MHSLRAVVLNAAVLCIDIVQCHICSSIRWDPEIGHGANNGLDTAIKILESIKKKYPTISWADTIQMARYIQPTD